jgi:hypothetical protein
MGTKAKLPLSSFRHYPWACEGARDLSCKAARGEKPEFAQQYSK